MIKFVDYEKEIFAICEANNVDVGVGVDMFINNIVDFGRKDDMYVYAGAEDVDYGALQAEYRKMRNHEVVESKMEFLAHCRKHHQG